MAQETLQTPEALLQSIFGYNQFRPQQEEAIEHILEGGDALVIMPTGGGKSLCYQIPALILPGLTVVISPLIALMNDQVEALKANGIAAAAINSHVSETERRQILERIQTGELRLLYVSPEKALSPGFSGYLQSLSLALIAVDEAHCVSMWGNDFRPEYAQLAGLFAQLPTVPLLALTATADPATQQDIVEKLRLRDPLRLLGSFERKNLYLEVQPALKRYQHIQSFLKERRREPGIIYCLARNTTEELATRLNAAGIRAAAYHARLDAAERSRVQADFQKDQIQVVCATIAFGMGIDKSNIRWIIHYNLPKNVESYYQEIGRAGRDGLPAHTLLFAGFYDVMTYRKMIDESEAGEVFKSVQIAKLDRMFDFAQARSCRTNFVLGYFGESRGEACGHCDLCKHPPRTFDGTVIAQKALSALRRTKEQVGIQLLVDILRGANLHEIRSAGYDKLKTFGLGREISRNHWVQYITQLVNLGILAIDYTTHSRLKISVLGEEVLFQGRQVSLVQPIEHNLVKDKKTAKLVVEKPKDIFRRELKELLVAWRLKAAISENIIPTHLLTDATLEDLVEQKALFKHQLKEISGFSSHKIQFYGDAVLQVIRAYVQKQDHVKTIKGITYLETLNMLQNGKTPEQISKERLLSISTIWGHMLWLYENEEPLNIHDYIPKEECLAYIAKWTVLGKPDTLAPVMEALGNDVDYNRLRLAIAWWNKEGPTRA